MTLRALAGIGLALLLCAPGLARAQTAIGATVAADGNCPAANAVNIGNSRPVYETQKGALCISGNISSSSASVGVNGAASPGSSDQIGSVVSGNLQPVSVANPLPVSGSLSIAGTTSNAGSAVATSSTNLPTVTYNYGFNGTTWDQLQVDASKNLKDDLVQIAGAPPSLTNPIWIANAEAADTSGTFTNATQTNSITNSNADGYATALLSLNGTYATASGVFEESDDAGTTYYPVICTRSDGTATETGYTSLTNLSRQWSCPVSGNDTVRIRSTAVASGTVNARVGITAPPNSSGVISGTINANTDSVVDGAVVTGSVGSAATLFTTNAQGYGWLELQFTSVGSGNTITVEQSNDGVAGTGSTFASSACWNLTTFSGAAVATVTIPTPTVSQVWACPVTGATMRARVSTFGSGTITTFAVLKRSQVPTPPNLTHSDLQTIAGNTALTGNGVTGTGSQRVTIASDNTPFSTNSILQTQTDTIMVGGTNIKEINAVAPLMGNGVTGTGSLRVTLASDTTSNTNPLLFNQSQMNGVALLAGNGVTGTGSQRVTIASDNTAFAIKLDQTDVTSNGVEIAPTAAAAAGIIPVVSASLESGHILKGSAGNLYSITATVNNNANGQIMVFNSATVPIDGAVTPIECINVNAGGTVSINPGTNGPPEAFSTGISVAFSSAGSCFTKTASANAFFNGKVK